MISITSPAVGTVFAPGQVFQLKGVNGPPIRCTVNVAGQNPVEVPLPSGQGDVFTFPVTAPTSVGQFVVFVEGEEGKLGSRTFSVASSSTND